MKKLKFKYYNFFAEFKEYCYKTVIRFKEVQIK